MELKYGVEIPPSRKNCTSRNSRNQRLVSEFYESGERCCEIIGDDISKSKYNTLKALVKRKELPVSVVRRENRLFLLRKDAE